MPSEYLLATTHTLINYNPDSTHYWKYGLCRVQTVLPSVKNRALGKKGHSAKDFFAECQALDKSVTLGTGRPA